MKEFSEIETLAISVILAQQDIEERWAVLSEFLEQRYEGITDEEELGKLKEFESKIHSNVLESMPMVERLASNQERKNKNEQYR